LIDFKQPGIEASLLFMNLRISCQLKRVLDGCLKIT
jgi:hypothetical protein